jgi:hypothetical protein
MQSWISMRCGKGMAGLNCGMISPVQTLIASGIRSVDGPKVCFVGQEQPIVPIEIEDQKPVEEALRNREQEL